MLKNRLLVVFLFTGLLCNAQEHEYHYTFFTNSIMPDDYFFSRTSASGGAAIRNQNNRLPLTTSNWHTAGNALILEYKNAPGGKWSAAIFRKEKRGMDHFKKATVLSFWMFKDFYPPLLVEMPKLQLMKSDSSLTSAVSMGRGKYNQWRQIIIPLNTIPGVDPNNLQEYIGVVFSYEGGGESMRHVLYIDDIEFTNPVDAGPITEKPVITSASDKYAKHVDITWNKITDKNIRFVKIYRSVNGERWYWAGLQPAYMNRYTDYVMATGQKFLYAISFLDNHYKETKRSPVVQGATRTMTDDELMTMVQEASFRYYWEAAEPVSGLARENLHGRHNMIATGASGFGMMALIAGTERKFITRKESVERFVKIVSFLEKADRFHGVYPHFIDEPTGKVEPFFGSRDNGADLVETAFLMQGLLAARQYFDGNDPDETLIRNKIDDIWKKTEWSWFKQFPDSKFLYWHWSPDQAWVINHPLIGWNETMIVYLLAMSSPTYAVPASMYYSGWANQDTRGRQYREGWGQTKEGSMYTNGNTYYGIKLDVGVSNGGPLFFTHYSYMGFDPHALTDKYTNYFNNNRNIALINYHYCVKNPKNFKGYGDSAWGLTASDGPFQYSADEPVTWQDNGKITPTGAISSFPYTPEESMKALKNYYYNHGKFLWGEYGFRDAFSPAYNWCSEIYMGLNQAPMTVMIENYRTGLIWKLFMKNPDIQNGLKKLAEAGKD